MPRSKRIEYEGVFHHVMNRGRSHGDIFHGRVYYESFLNLLKDSSERFDAVVHAYYGGNSLKAIRYEIA